MKVDLHATIEAALRARSGKGITNTRLIEEALVRYLGIESPYTVTFEVPSDGKVAEKKQSARPGLELLSEKHRETLTYIEGKKPEDRSYNDNLVYAKLQRIMSGEQAP